MEASILYFVVVIYMRKEKYNHAISIVAAFAVVASVAIISQILQ